MLKVKHLNSTILVYVYIYEKEVWQESVGLLRLSDQRGLIIYINIST